MKLDGGGYKLQISDLTKKKSLEVSCLRALFEVDVSDRIC